MPPVFLFGPELPGFFAFAVVRRAPPPVATVAAVRNPWQSHLHFGVDVLVSCLECCPEEDPTFVERGNFRLFWERKDGKHIDLAGIPMIRTDSRARMRINDGSRTGRKGKEEVVFESCSFLRTLSDHESNDFVPRVLLTLSNLAGIYAHKLFPSLCPFPSLEFNPCLTRLNPSPSLIPLCS